MKKLKESLAMKFIALVLAVMFSAMCVLAVGGVDENNIAEYVKAGINGFGLGSNIIDKKKIAENDWAGITELAKKYVSLVK